MRHRRRLVGCLLAVCAVLLSGLAFDVPSLHRLAAPGAPHDPTPAHEDAAPTNPTKLAQARAKIKHVVFVLLENHSFDNIFGRFPGADGATTGRTSTGGDLADRHGQRADAVGAEHPLIHGGDVHGAVGDHRAPVPGLI